MLSSTSTNKLFSIINRQNIMSSNATSYILQHEGNPRFDLIRSTINLKATHLQSRLDSGDDAPLKCWPSAEKCTAHSLLSNSLTAGTVFLLEDGLANPAVLIEPSTRAAKEDYYIVHLDNELKNAYPSYICKQDMVGFILTITSEHEAKEVGLFYDPHDLRQPYPANNVVTITTRAGETATTNTTPDDTPFWFPHYPEDLGGAGTEEKEKTCTRGHPKSNTL